MSSFSSVPLVSVHPTVLLSIVDHYTRQVKGTGKRVVGTLLGEVKADGLHVTGSFAVPFEEDSKDPSLWFLDHDYHETMFEMFKKVNPKERTVGWYSSGPKIKPCDMEIHEVYRRYCADQNPVFVIVDVQGSATHQDEDGEEGLPIKSYVSAEDFSGCRTFLHIASAVAAVEAEEVGVEHLLKDVRNSTASTLAVSVMEKVSALRTLGKELGFINNYLAKVDEGKLPMNNEILYNLQNILTSLSCNRAAFLGDQTSEDCVLQRVYNEEQNDSMLGIYLGSILRATVALHELIDNKLKNKKESEAMKLKRKEDERKTEGVAPIPTASSPSENQAAASGA